MSLDFRTEDYIFHVFVNALLGSADRLFYPFLSISLSEVHVWHDFPIFHGLALASLMSRAAMLLAFLCLSFWSPHRTIILAFAGMSSFGLPMSQSATTYVTGPMLYSQQPQTTLVPTEFVQVAQPEFKVILFHPRYIMVT